MNLLYILRFFSKVSYNRKFTKKNKTAAIYLFNVTKLLLLLHCRSCLKVFALVSTYTEVFINNILTNIKSIISNFYEFWHLLERSEKSGLYLRCLSYEHRNETERCEWTVHMQFNINK